MGSKLPMKLKIFMWQACQDRLQTGVALKRKKWKGSMYWVVCGAPKSGDHLFFSCVSAKFIWTSFKEVLGWDRAPYSLQDFFDNWSPLGCVNYNLKLFLLGVVLRVLWITRNKLAIEGVPPKSLSDLFYKIHSFLQRWLVLLGGADQHKMDKLILQVQEWVSSFQEDVKVRPPFEDFF
jgi:hypothetical protein